MKRYADLIADARTRVREPAEFASARIPGSINVPRGVLEAACEWDYDDTVPVLAASRERAVVVVCRSGLRSLLAADVMQAMGFRDVASLGTGVRGWNDFERPLVDAAAQPVDADRAERLLAASVRPDQFRPRRTHPGRG